MAKTPELVEVYRAHGELEALVVKGLLEDCGIRSLLKSDASLSVHVLTADGMGQVSVMVRSSDADAAREVLSQREHLQSGDDIDTDSEAT